MSPVPPIGEGRLKAYADAVLALLRERGGQPPAELSALARELAGYEQTAKAAGGRLMVSASTFAEWHRAVKRGAKRTAESGPGVAT